MGFEQSPWLSKSWTLDKGKSRLVTHKLSSALFLANVNLETDDVPILDFALSKRRLRFHEFDHAWLDLFVQLQWCARSPAHPLVDGRCQITDFGIPLRVAFTNTMQSLL